MALLLGLAMLPAGAIAMQVGLNAVEARQAAFEQTLGRRALQSIAVERGVVDELREMLQVLAAAPSLPSIARGDCNEWLGAVMQRYSYLNSIGVSNTEGRVLCSVPQAPIGFISRSPLREVARARNAFALGYIDQSALTNRPVLGAFTPLHDERRRLTGFISASISVEQLSQILDRSRALDGARAAILDDQGRVIAQSTPPASDADAPSLPSPEQVRDRLGPDPVFIDVRGGEAVVAPLHAPDLYIALSWRPERPSWDRWGAIAITIAAPVLIWLLAIGAGWFAIEVYVTRPLSSLESAARSFARGEDITDPPALMTAPEEIRSLRRTLAAMAKTLRGREQRLIEALAEERALLREVHHRVKNNLQLVASLLNIQARGSKDESEARGLARAHDRVQLLALVHQRIYASGEVRELRVDDLAADIARRLLQSHGLQAANIMLDFTEVRADADKAVPLSFLIGEGISGVLDAIAGKDSPGASFHLCQDPDGEVRFAIIADIAEATISAQSARLIDAFARQLGATVGRDPSRPLALWVRAPSPASA